MVGGVVSPAGEQVAYPLHGELGTLKAPASPEVEESIYWDQEADFVLCTCINPCDQIWAAPAKFGRKSSILTSNIFANFFFFDK
jgi:hypothetical protein